MNWISVTSPSGAYESKRYRLDIQNDTVFANVEPLYKNDYNQRIEYSYRYSLDGSAWTDWYPLPKGMGNLFAGQSSKTYFFQYRVVMEAKSEQMSPQLFGLRMMLYPFEHVHNNGDLNAYPKLWIKKLKDKGDITLYNVTTEQELKLKNLAENEEVFIDTYDQIIKSSNEPLGVYRYDDHNNVWLQFAPGDNYLDGMGEFSLDIRFYAPMLQD